VIASRRLYAWIRLQDFLYLSLFAFASFHSLPLLLPLVLTLSYLFEMVDIAKLAESRETYAHPTTAKSGHGCFRQMPTPSIFASLLVYPGPLFFSLCPNVIIQVNDSFKMLWFSGHRICPKTGMFALLTLSVIIKLTSKLLLLELIWKKICHC
jgi:hypothetical protein